MRNSNFWVGLLIGGLAGAAAVLLYTPNSGKGLRSQACNYLTQMKAEMQQASQARRAQLEGQLSDLRTPHS